MENSIDLHLRENLQTEPEYDFVKNMGLEPLGFKTDWVEGKKLPKNTEFMATRCFESNRRFSITPPCV
jgi:hypothetical protein